MTIEILNLISLIGNVVIPPLFSLIKSLFGIKDNPENTLSTLALNKPETLPDYIKAQSLYLEAETKFFQRDISGTPSQWVIDLRACIRPISVILSFGILFSSLFGKIPDEVLLTCNGVIGNWLGTKLNFHR